VKRLLIFVASLAAFGLALGDIAAAQAQGPKPNELDALFSALVSPHEPGLAVLVLKNGMPAFERGYGVRDLRSKTPIDLQTNFRLASLTKQFTAMAIMLLVHDGKLRYDQTLTEIFPDFPSYGKKITILHMLNHTSGLPSYEAAMDNYEKAHGPTWSPEKQIQDAEVFDLLKQERSGKFAPGTSWAYSNSGYVMLGLIVAKASGKPYREFLQERIFAPVKMNRSIVYQKGTNKVVNRAFGHSKEGGAFKETDQSSTSATLGDGGIYTNLEDLIKWDAALRNHTLLSEKEFQPALTPAKLNDGSQTYWPVGPDEESLYPGKPVSYGFGWLLDPFFAATSQTPHARMWHGGSTTGFSTAIERFTIDSLTVIILCNRTDLDVGGLAMKVATSYLPTK
jgi:CubicO group peptidase (beta-lactamase class C family)